MAEAGTKLSKEQKIAKLRDAYAAFDRGDINAVMEFVTDDAVWHGAGTTKYGQERRGKQEILQQLAMLPQDFEEFKLEVHDIMASDDHIAVLLSQRSKRKGVVYEDKQVHVHHLTDDGRSRELWIVNDTEKLKTALES